MQARSGGTRIAMGRIEVRHRRGDQEDAGTLSSASDPLPPGGPSTRGSRREAGLPRGDHRKSTVRAREQLRTRLTRRGLAPTASALGLALNPLDSSAAVPLSSMIEPTIEAAIRLSSRRVGGYARNGPCDCAARLETLSYASDQHGRYDDDRFRGPGRDGIRGFPGGRERAATTSVERPSIPASRPPGVRGPKRW